LLLFVLIIGCICSFCFVLLFTEDRDSQNRPSLSVVDAFLFICFS